MVNFSNHLLILGAFAGSLTSNNFINFEFESNYITDYVTQTLAEVEGSGAYTDTIGIGNSFSFGGSGTYDIENDILNYNIEYVNINTNFMYSYVNPNNDFISPYYTSFNDIFILNNPLNIEYSYGNYDRYILKFDYYFSYVSSTSYEMEVSLIDTFTEDELLLFYSGFDAMGYFPMSDYNYTHTPLFTSEVEDFGFDRLTEDIVKECRTFNSDISYNVAYQTGYNQGFSSGADVGYSDGYSAGFNDGSSVDETAFTIFNGILNIALVPINFFLSIFNFEILGINISAVVSALLTICITIIIIKTFMGGKGGDTE